MSMEFKVIYKVSNAAEIAGTEPDKQTSECIFCDADTADEAISLAQDSLTEQCNANNYSTEPVNDGLLIKNAFGDICEKYTQFSVDTEKVMQDLTSGDSFHNEALVSLDVWNPLTETAEEWLEDEHTNFLKTHFNFSDEECKAYAESLWAEMTAIVYSKPIVYINDSYNGIAIFSQKDLDGRDCLYYCTWFNENDFNTLAKMAEDGNIEGIEDFCYDCDSWDGNSADEEDGLKTWKEFTELNDFENWTKIA